MNKLLRFSLFLFVLFPFINSAQAQTSNITGKITGSAGEVLTGAVAELRFVSDSSLAKASVADNSGKYNLEGVKSGKYYIKTSFLGFNPHFTDAFIFDGVISKAMPEIVMEVSAVMLESAEITGIKPLVEVKADKTVFNVENSINSTGSTAFELLQKAPGVVVDNNDNISLKGRGGVMVQIDGRPSRLSETELADYLKNVQSTDVEAIELISNPSSKYDAEGTAGIINIKLKKNKNYGTNGGVTAGYAYGDYAKYNGALSLNTRTKKFNIFSNYSSNFGDRGNEFYLYREQSPYIYNQSSIRKRTVQSHNFKAGVDYSINKKNTVGIMVNGNISASDGKETNRNNISNFYSGNLDSILISNQSYESNNDNYNINLNHRYADTLGHELNTDFDYGYYDSDRNTYQPNEYVTPVFEFPLSSAYYRSITPTTIKIFTLGSDYSQKLWQGKLGVGYKLSYVTTDNTFNFYNFQDGIEIIDNSRSNQFDYSENVNAVYLNYQQTVKKFDFQVGVRVENTNSEGNLNSQTLVANENVKRSYTDFFPSAGITYNFHKNHSTAFIYSSRIDRPNYQELNPFEYKLDELSYRKGNPFLNPQYSQKVEISHTYKYTTSLSVGYSHTSDFFAQIADTVSGGIGYLTPKNLASEDVISANLSTSQQPLKWYGIYLNAGVYNQRYDADFGEGKTINTNFTSFNLYAQNTIKLPYKFTFEISGWFNSGGVWGGSYKTEAQGSLDLGLQKKLFAEKASLKLTVTDILNTAPWSSYNTYAGIVSKANGNWESQQFRASFSYRFGNNQVKSIRQRSTGSESEQKRIGGGD